ncbi:hypothetical protein HMPREF1983_00697 [Gemella bergeri ATCC 700627]|uniref:Conjugal transfer protein n=1 Tax=Gemella bergeri ATCC 700627 TaxID=1321820 RepID=U2S7L0_9BACL|nr:cysteine-rich KTR domain-containing protein [Gemella bergeri]ERK58797.1 hypothetical protein HMPREF1983_00697 [Gemella bergeri ATCC 700627]
MPQNGYCVLYKRKTRIKLRKNIEFKKFPLYCPMCKLETLVNIKELKVTIIKEMDAKIQNQQCKI